MKCSYRRVVLSLAALLVMVALVLGPAASGVDVATPAFDGMHGLLCPSAHAGSGAT